jgi:hypothetical protein
MSQAVVLVVCQWICDMILERSTKSTSRRRREEMVLSSSWSDLTTRRATTRSDPRPDSKNHFSSGQKNYNEERPDEESNHDATTIVPFVRVREVK